MIAEPRCRACVSRKREEIDRALRAGRSVREIGKQYALSKSSLDRHRTHVELSAVDPATECEQAAALIDQFLAAPMESAEDVLRGGKQLLDSQLRFARGLARDNPRAASAIVQRAQNALVELHAKAFRVIGNDSVSPTAVDNSTQVYMLLERFDVDTLRGLAKGVAPLAIGTTIDQAPE